uniref:RNA-directed DNA polymerase n=1 Tax=Ixodes ricinus TaxID=34613 RepID=A0A131XQ90_IXORI
MAVNGIGEYRYGTKASWDEYVERLEMYCVANKLSTDDEKRAVLLSSCGAETYSLIVTLVKPARPTATSYEDLKQAVRKHVHPKPSVLYARFLFYKRNQEQRESVPDYVTALRKLAEDCGFGTKELPLDVMMRDRFVCGIRDEAVQQRLLAEAESKLTFATAYDMAVTAEATHQQQREIRGQAGDDASSPANPTVHSTHTKGASPKHAICYRCNGKHSPASCTFRSAICYHCHKTGHIAKACRSRRASPSNKQKTAGRERKSEQKQERKSDKISRQLSEVEELFSVSEVEEQKKFLVSVLIQGKEVSMEVHSGASCSIVSEATFRALESRQPIPLESTGTQLVTWTKEPLLTVGKAMVRVNFKERSATLPLLVVRKQGNSLLGRSWFKALGITIEGIKNLTSSADVIERFSEVFSKDLPGCNHDPVHIDLKEEAQPVFLKSRSVPFALKDDVAKEIDSLVQQGVWEPVQSATWATPIVVVRKKNGSLRLCGDYRSTVNKAVKSSVYPLPTTNEVLSTLGSSNYFTKLDLAQAYQQLVLDDSSAEVLTVNTMKGLYKVRRLPFGISVAPWLFQRVIDTLLAGIPGVKAYLDDILISGNTQEEHGERLEAVLTRLQDARFRVNKEKCEFSQTSIEFLGHLINADGVHPSPSKTEAIHEAPAPSSKKELQSFLGLINFYSRFLKGKAELAEPLHRLLDKGSAWSWNREHQKAFCDLKKLLASDAVLVPYDPQRPVVLSCDASPVGVGAVLAHREADGTERPIAYASKTLGSSERNYAQIDREGLAVVYGVKKFHQYLAGRSFTILTDHQPLLGLFNRDKRIPEVVSPRMLRWILLLAAYDYSIEHRPGPRNGNADALSRLPKPGHGDESQPPGDVLLLEAIEFPPLRATDIADLTKKDAVLSRVKNWILSGWPSTKVDTYAAYEVRKAELSLHRDCILWGSRVVIPEAARKAVLELLHANHPGMTAMKASARSLMWWPKMDQEIEDFVRRCDRCQSNRQSDAKAPVHFWIKPDQPWSRLQIDFAGPVKGEVFLVVVDAYSNWAEL